MAPIISNIPIRCDITHFDLRLRLAFSVFIPNGSPLYNKSLPTAFGSSNINFYCLLPTQYLSGTLIFIVFSKSLFSFWWLWPTAGQVIMLAMTVTRPSHIHFNYFIGKSSLQFLYTYTKCCWCFISLLPVVAHVICMCQVDNASPMYGGANFSACAYLQRCPP